MPSTDSTRPTPDKLPVAPEITVHLRPDPLLGYAAIVSMHGEHDLATSSELTSALAPLTGNVLLDLSACEFLDSTVIGVIVAKSAGLGQDGHRLELVVPSSNAIVNRVVDVVGLRTLMTVHPQAPGLTIELDSGTSSTAAAV